MPRAESSSIARITEFTIAYTTLGDVRSHGS
jgi:hypothetical protein